MQPEGSLPCSQEPTTCPYLEQDASYFPRIHSDIILPYRVFLEKVVVTQLVKKSPASYGTRRFITVFTRARN